MLQTKISAIIHVHVRESGLHLGRALDSLRMCEELIVVDHSGWEETVHIAREQGSRVLRGIAGENPASYAQQATYDWILCLLPEESVAEPLEASLLEWQMAEHSEAELAFNIAIREQQGTGWQVLPAETRLVHRKKVRWRGEMPENEAKARMLEGHILRFQDKD